MTEQPVETEQQFLGNAPRLGDAIVQSFPGVPLTEAQEKVLDSLLQQPARQSYVPNAHRGRFSPLRDKAKQDIKDAIAERAAIDADRSVGYSVHQQAILDELAAASLPAEDLTMSPKTDLLLEAEVHTTHALAMLQSNELDAGIAWLQSALAMALNQRHIEQFGGARA